MQKAKRTHQIVASLFPKNIREQILNDDGDLRHGGILGAKKNLKSFVNSGMDNNHIFGQMPIADMYPESTIMVSFNFQQMLSGRIGNISSFNLVLVWRYFRLHFLVVKQRAGPSLCIIADFVSGLR